jgi:hypothetical protein
MKRNKWAIGFALLLLGWLAAHFFAQLSDEPPMWQVLFSLAVTGTGAVALNKATTIE